MSVDQNDLIEILSDPWGITFQDVRAMGGHLTLQSLTTAYTNGYFPWPHADYPMLWFSPDKRGVIDFNELHFPKSFKKWLKKNNFCYEIKYNQDFEKILSGCQLQLRPGQEGTWITEEILKSYTELFYVGQATCCGVYKNKKLVAGIYGVQTRSYVSLESMFHLEDNTSKLALVSMISFLKEQGYSWVDIQMVSDVSKAFGGKYITRHQFLKRILRPL